MKIIENKGTDIRITLSEEDFCQKKFVFKEIRLGRAAFSAATYKATKHKLWRGRRNTELCKGRHNMETISQNPFTKS